MTAVASTFASRVIQFNKQLHYTGPPLPEGIRIMNPFRESEFALDVSSRFYNKFYHDNNERSLILGINPGRFGAGLTGVPFTDPKRLQAVCGIDYPGKVTHEPSSVFVYEMIDAFGGVTEFYRKFYIHSVCPLGFTQQTGVGKEKNYNYYDSKALLDCTAAYNVNNIREQIAMGVRTDTCFCWGKGKNEAYLRAINNVHGFFGNIVALEHPRFIMQYKSGSKASYIRKYLDAFGAGKG